MRSLLFLLLSWVGCATVLAQAPRLTATASDTRVEQYGLVRVTYTVEGGEATGFEAPSFDGFAVLGGPSRESSTTIINGRVRSSFRISYNLSAKQPGRFRIAPASMEIGGRRVRSEAIDIEVVPIRSPSADLQGEDAEVFARTSLERDTVYVGQRIVLQTELFNRVNIRTYSMLTVPTMVGLQIDQLRRFDSYARQRDIGGRQYQVSRVQVLEAFATLPGRYEIEPQVFEVRIPEEGRRSSFLFGPPTRTERVSTAPQVLTVLPLPQNAPPDFIGAVGSWRFGGGFADSRDLTTSDALTFRLSARGRGDVSRLTAPALDWPEGWRALPVQTTREESFETDTGMVFVREFEYTLVPERPGRFALAPSVSYFDVDSRRYETWEAVPIELDVTGSGATGASDDGGAEAGDVSPPVAFPERPNVIRGYWVTQPWYWMLMGLVPLSVLGAWVYRVLRKRKTQRPEVATDPLLEGRQRLANARTRLDEPVAFYAALGEALDRFAQDRLGLARSEQSGAALRSAFAKTGNADDAEAFLRAKALADQGRYGGGTDRAGREQALGELERVLSL